MGVSRKNKRKIVVNETIFYWYVKWEDDWWLENTIRVFDNNMQLIFYYIVGQDKTRISDRYLQSPIWINSNGLHDPERVDIITPHIVSQIIKWCLENKNNE